MPILPRRLLYIIFSAFLFWIAPAANGTKATHIQQRVASIQPPSSIKPIKLKEVFSKIVAKLLTKKKSRSVAAIAFGILSVLLVSLLVFGAAYGGASGGAIALIAVVGLGLIVFGLIKISKARKRIQNRTGTHE